MGSEKMNEPKLEWILLRGPRTPDITQMSVKFLKTKEANLTGYSYLRTVENKYEEWVPTEEANLTGYSYLRAVESVPTEETNLTGYSYLRTVESKYEEWVPTEELELYKKVLSNEQTN
jgi:hypothetical protein